CGANRSDISYVSPRRLARWRKAWGPSLDAECVERWIRSELLRHRQPVKIHPGVDRIDRSLRERLERSDDLSLKTISPLAGLSTSRFVHAFTESVGVPFRQYILWLRLQRAACDLVHGVTATEAAHTAGFSDAP